MKREDSVHQRERKETEHAFLFSLMYLSDRRERTSHAKETIDERPATTATHTHIQPNAAAGAHTHRHTRTCEQCEQRHIHIQTCTRTRDAVRELELPPLSRPKIAIYGTPLEQGSLASLTYHSNSRFRLHSHLHTNITLRRTDERMNE